MVSTRRLPAPALLLALSILAACGREFTAVEGDASEAGAGGSDVASMGGSAEAGMNGSGAVSHGGAGTAGDRAVGGMGIPPVSGEAGSGEDPVVSLPVIPLEGLELWLRADEGVGQVGDVVSSWQDGSDHARDALQIEAGSRPKLAPAALSGKAALVFDGVDDFLALPALDADLSRGVSMFIAFQQEAVGSCGAWFEASNGREQQELHFGDWKSSVIYEIAESWLNDTSYPLLMGEPQVTAAIHGADKMVRLRTNGRSAGQGAVTLAASGLSRKYVYVGKTLYTDCSYFKGSIGEILLYSRAVSSQEMLDIEGYLQSKWACCQ